MSDQTGKIGDQGKKLPPNPPAFPRSSKAPGSTIDEKGMSLRDYFAGQALGGLLASAGKGVVQAQCYDENASWEVIVAANAYRHADAMMEARQRKEGA